MNDSHFFIIFVWIIATLATNTNSWKKPCLLWKHKYGFESLLVSCNWASQKILPPIERFRVLSKFQGSFFRHNVLNCRKACRKCCHHLSNTSELRIRLSYETGSQRLHPCNFVTLFFASGVPMCKSTARVFTNYHNLSKEVCRIGRCIYYIPRIKFSSSHVITNACRCSLSVPIILHLHAQNMSPIYTSSN